MSDEQTTSQPTTQDPTPVESSAVSAGTDTGPKEASQNRGGFERRGRGTRGRGPGRGPGRTNRYGGEAKPEYDQKVLDIARVARVTKGGKRFSFRATVIIGNGKGKVGMGIGRGRDVAQSMQKAYNRAKRDLITVTVDEKGTIPHQVEAKYNSAIVLLKPARGGVKAGGPVRVIAQLSGIHALTGKLLGRTNNKINIAMATLKALTTLRVNRISQP